MLKFSFYCELHNINNIDNSKIHLENLEIFNVLPNNCFKSYNQGYCQNYSLRSNTILTTQYTNLELQMFVIENFGNANVSTMRLH